MKIGIIGAENSHTLSIARIINVEKKVRGFTVDYVWGEKHEFALKAAAEGKIPNVVKSPRQMLGKVDAVVVDHRHGKYHLPAVLPFLKAGVPLFVDKPFCFDSREGLRFLKLARELKTPVTSFSTITLQKSFLDVVKKIKNGSFGPVYSAMTYGPCDIKSKYGGIFFYGIHQVDMALNAFGYDVASVRMLRNGDNGVGHLIYPSGLIVGMALVKNYRGGFGISISSEKGLHAQILELDDNHHLPGVKTFCRMFKTGREPLSHERVIRPVQVLEGLAKSLKSGKVVKIWHGSKTCRFG